ncbi:unnamed protein product [Spirodela intermedia]|uniref:Retrotransposon gag domain-containing protein n=1 Tax=Spirodela intermedia TaxID=51605 RepID=A0A7I8KJE5_SPIIN|nr:unnamed protein product [Spirodela intermedia]
MDPKGSTGQTKNNPMAMKNHYIPDSFQRASNIRVPLAPTVKFEINPGIFQMLPNFHGLPLEEPHQHLEKFHMVCDLVNLPQAFLRKFYPLGKTQNMRKHLWSFSQRPGETLHETWKKFKDLLRKCPHHAIPKWQLNRIFYDGLLEQHRNMVDSICGGAFMEKTPDEIYSLYENLSENSSDQASFELYDRDKKRGIYELHHDDDSKLRNEVNQINQRLEKIDLLIDNIRKPFNPQLNSNSTCPMYGENDYSEFQCYNLDQSFHPMQEQVQVAHGFNRNREPFSNSYNPNWRNNFSWRDPNNIQNPEALRPNSNSEFRPKQENKFQKNQPSQTQPDTMEMMQQMSQMIQPIENPGNRPTIGFQQGESSNMNLGKNPRNENVRTVNALRSGKILPDPYPQTLEEKENMDNPKQNQIGVEEDFIDSTKEISKERTTIPFPKALEPRQRKKKEHNEEIKKILQDVQISLPLLTATKHIPEYARVLKEMCTPKRAPRVEKLSVHASALLLNQLPYKLRDTGAPLISCDIGGFIFQNALLNTGASINLLPASICDKFNISDLKPSTVTLKFVDRSIKHPKGILENVIVTVKGCKFPADFVVLEMDFNGQFYDMLIILGRPFLHIAKMNIDFPTDLLDDFDDPDVIDDCVLEELEEIENINLGEKKEEDHLNLELKPLPSSLKYMFLEENNSFPVIIAADLSDEQEEELLDVL